MCLRTRPGRRRRRRPRPKKRKMGGAGSRSRSQQDQRGRDDLNIVERSETNGNGTQTTIKIVFILGIIWSASVVAMTWVRAVVMAVPRAMASGGRRLLWPRYSSTTRDSGILPVSQVNDGFATTHGQTHPPVSETTHGDLDWSGTDSANARGPVTFSQPVISLNPQDQAPPTHVQSPQVPALPPHGLTPQDPAPPPHGLMPQGPVQPPYSNHGITPQDPAPPPGVFTPLDPAPPPHGDQGLTSKDPDPILAPLDPVPPPDADYTQPGWTGGFSELTLPDPMQSATWPSQPGAVNNGVGWPTLTSQSPYGQSDSLAQHVHHRPGVTHTSASMNVDVNVWTCSLPGCSRPCYVETSGRVHDYCGRTHAQQHRRMMEGPQVISPLVDTGTGPILFYNRDEPYYEFTNFYRVKVKLDGKWWPTTEHYFQAQKFIGTPYVEQFRKLEAPRMAFNLSRNPQVSRWRRKDWEEEKVKVMYKALLAKFTQHQSLRDLLLGTGDRELIEHSPYDSYWGDGGDGRGENMLGKLLVKVRGELRGEKVEMPQPSYLAPQLPSSSIGGDVFSSLPPMNLPVGTTEPSASLPTYAMYSTSEPLTQNDPPFAEEDTSTSVPNPPITAQTSETKDTLTAAVESSSHGAPEVAIASQEQQTPIDQDINEPVPVVAEGEALLGTESQGGMSTDTPAVRTNSLPTQDEPGPVVPEGGGMPGNETLSDRFPEMHTATPDPLPASEAQSTPQEHTGTQEEKRTEEKEKEAEKKEDGQTGNDT